MSADNTVRVRLRSRIICPHCWYEFAPEQALWIAEHSDLMGDLRLGPDHPMRFLPSRFTPQGQALDPQDLPSSKLACPQCHLQVFRGMFEFSTCFWSILGAPGCGKSYFIASMVSALRVKIPQLFNASFTDLDPLTNAALKRAESLLFHNEDPSQLVFIDKTKTSGIQYSAVRYGDRVVSYPNPYLFTMSPLPSHPKFDNTARSGQIMCLYDNAGEHFLPGQDDAESPATRHMAHSQGLFFLFDPMQDAKFRRVCQGVSTDPQLHRPLSTDSQVSVLQEAANRIRGYVGMPEHQQYNRPLIVLVTKFDAWWRMLGVNPLPTLYRRSKSGLHAVDTTAFQNISAAVRELLWTHATDLVSTAEAFASKVIFLPVSATGCSPEESSETGALGVRGDKLKPIWAEAPMLFALSHFTRAGLIPSWRESKPADTPASTDASAATSSVWPPGQSAKRSDS